MKDMDRSLGFRDHDDILQKLKSNLRREVWADVKSMGLRQSMTDEYWELAGATMDLLALMEKYRFSEKLETRDQDAYDSLMLRISSGATRCQILVEESTKVDNEALLAVIQPESNRIN